MIRDRRAGRHRMTRHGAGRDFFQNLPLRLAVAAAHRVAVHQRLVVRRRIDVARDVLGQHQPGRLAQRHPPRRERRGVLRDKLQRFFNGEHD